MQITLLTCHAKLFDSSRTDPRSEYKLRRVSTILQSQNIALILPTFLPYLYISWWGACDLLLTPSCMRPNTLGLIA